MKALGKFEAFKLNKNQMNAIVGGDPPITDYLCSCLDTGEEFHFYTEKNEQIEEVSNICGSTNVRCIFMGVEE